MSDVRLLRVRGNAPYEGVSANPMEATGNKFGEQIVAQGQLGVTELSRLGRSYEVSIATANAFTFVAVWPTTRSELVIFNSSGAGGHSLVIDRCWLTNVTSQAAAQHFSLLGQITPTSPVIAAPTDAGTTVVQTSLNGKVSALGRLGVAVFALASTAFALANHWFILGNSAASAMTTNLGASLSAECFGRYIIPPGAAFNLAGLAGTAAGTAIIGCEYHEVKLDLG